ncbi:MAG: TolC family protein [Prevotellaceae bacterium]|jgi:outer membrane protein TolC|nr:TolC family protein [Prevotellaceae bacterium]
MKHLLFISFIFIPVLSFSQDKIWTLDECVNYALEYNKQIAKQAAQNSIYGIDKREIIAGFLPSISAGTSVSSNFGRGVDPETNTYISTSTFGNSYEIYASVVLFDGFSQIYKFKMANNNRLLGKVQLQDVKDRVALDVMEIFFNVLYYKGTVNLAEERLQESLNDLKRVKRMEELGMKSFPDVAEIEAKEAEDRFTLTKQENLLRLEIICLKEKMNLPVDEDLAIVEMENSNLATHSDENPAEIFGQASQTLPKLLSSEQTLKAKDAEYKMTRSRISPTISASAGFSTGFSRLMDGSPYVSFKEQLRNREGSYIGLSLSVPLFDRLSRISETRRSKQRLIIAKNENEEIKRQVYGEIEQTLADVKGLHDERNAAERKAGAMEAAHKVNVRKYEEGLINALELSTSSNRLLQSRIEALYTNLKYQLKCRLLQYYKGESF